MPDPERRPYVCGNWKMFKTIAETREFVRAMVPKLDADGPVEVGVCVPYLGLAAAVEEAQGSPLVVAAQNMSRADEGAYTGDVSAPMLLEIGVQDVLLGHSERRQYNGETDRALQEKVPKALEAGLRPILCVGESEAEHEAGETQRRLRHQVQEALDRVPEDRLADVVIAYEPVWAIGTGKSATPDQAQEPIAFIRALVGDRSKVAARRVRVLYGGSVKPENAGEILAQPDVDGALVGGASLDPDSLAAIVTAASS